MPLQLKPITVEEQYMKALIYGEPGSGKTSLAATAAQHPNMSPVAILNLEGGLLSVANLPNVYQVDIRDSADMDEAYWALTGNSEEFRAIRTVVIDSGTEFANRTLAEWVQKGMARAAAKGRNVGDRTIDDVQLEDYGKLTTQLRRVFSWYRDLPKHTIVTALAKSVYPPNADTRTSAPLEIRPAFTDALGTSVMGFFDHLWYLYTAMDPSTQEVTRYMLTQRMNGIICKTRGTVFPSAIGTIVTAPNLAELYATLLSSENATAPTDPAPLAPVEGAAPIE